MYALKYKRFACALVLLCAASVFAAGQSGGLKGRVRANSGSPVSNAQVTVTKGSSDVKTTRSKSDGSFEIAGLEPGYYGLRIDADGFASASMFSVEIKKDKVRDLGDKLFLRVDQGTLVILRGSVFFKEGTSIGGARVELEKANSDGSFRRIATAETSESGEFVFRQPQGAAKYRVTARYEGVSGTKEMSVENAAVYRLAISLDLSQPKNWP